MPADQPLTPAQIETLLELASRGSGGLFDQQAIYELFGMGLVEIRNEDRRVVLTERGKMALAGLRTSSRHQGDGQKQT